MSESMLHGVIYAIGALTCIGGGVLAAGLIVSFANTLFTEAIFSWVGKKALWDMALRIRRERQQQRFHQHQQAAPRGEDDTP